MSVYLDYNATAPVRPEAAAAVAEALARTGNPSSVHAAGRDARMRLEAARADVAGLVEVGPTSLVFTSGGTEANALAIGSAVAAGLSRLIVSAVEHDAVWETANAAGAQVEVLPVDARGVADLEALEHLLEAGDRAFVALMAANNETGVIQPVAEAGELVRAAGGWLHVDAVQAAGKIPLGFRELGADTMALSAHKLGGPQGVGALAFGARAALTRQLHGGGQERGVRAGTENLSGVLGFAAAARTADGAIAMQAAWRDAAQARMAAAGGVVMGKGAPRLPNTLCIAAPGWPAELQVMGLDLAGVMVSSGAACSSGKVKASRVLGAMGAGELAACAIRASGGWATTESDWNRLAETWVSLYERHAARRRAPAA